MRCLTNAPFALGLDSDGTPELLLAWDEVQTADVLWDQLRMKRQTSDTDDGLKTYNDTWRFWQEWQIAAILSSANTSSEPSSSQQSADAADVNFGAVVGYCHYDYSFPQDSDYGPPPVSASGTWGLATATAYASSAESGGVTHSSNGNGWPPIGAKVSGPGMGASSCESFPYTYPTATKSTSSSFDGPSVQSKASNSNGGNGSINSAAYTGIYNLYSGAGTSGGLGKSDASTSMQTDPSGGSFVSTSTATSRGANSTDIASGDAAGSAGSSHDDVQTSASTSSYENGTHTSKADLHYAGPQAMHLTAVSDSKAASLADLWSSAGGSAFSKVPQWDVYAASGAGTGKGHASADMTGGAESNLITSKSSASSSGSASGNAYSLYRNPLTQSYDAQTEADASSTGSGTQESAARLSYSGSDAASLTVSSDSAADAGGSAWGTPFAIAPGVGANTPSGSVNTSVWTNTLGMGDLKAKTIVLPQSVTTTLRMDGENSANLTSGASGAQGPLQADITLNSYSGTTGSIVSGQNTAKVLPGVNPQVVSTHVLADVQALGAGASAAGQKLRTTLEADQEPDNGTFDFGVSELVFAIAGRSTPTYASVEFELWRDTNGDGTEDASTGWKATAKLELVWDSTLGYAGRITATDAWDVCDFELSVIEDIVPSFVATLRPDARLQSANVNPEDSYLLVSKYNAQAYGAYLAGPAAAAVQYDVSYAAPVPPLEANLTAYRPRHGAGYAPFGRTAVPDVDIIEESATLGPGIRINPAGNADDPVVEDDLIEVTIKREQGLGDLFLVRENSNLKVYRDPQGTSEIPFVNNQTAPLDIGAGGQMTVYVEWAGTNHGTADLTVNSCHGDVLDTLKFHTFQSAILGLGGFTEMPALAGTYSAARDLYQEGYDTYWFSHGDFRDAGTEIISGLAHRFVSNVAMWGYSLGGNRMHDVAERIDDAGYGSRIRYTAYIDAIDIVLGVTWSERDKPPGSPIHDSFYQRVDIELRGNSTVNNLEGLTQTTFNSLSAARAAGFPTAVTNVDVSDEVATPGFVASHSKIDDYAFDTRAYLDRTTSLVPTR